jgi:hypothetical protein
MKQIAFRRLTGFAAVVLLGPLLAGCDTLVPLYYAYPTVTHVPALPIKATDDGVQAFRVDVVDQDNGVNFPEEDSYVLTPVPLGPDGTVPAQTRVALDYGWILSRDGQVHDGQTRNTVLVRLYRPGWQTVEYRSSWDKVSGVAWKAAADPAAREKAVDDVLLTWATDFQGYRQVRAQAGKKPAPAPDYTLILRHLAPGSASASHRQVMQFAADEYERLLGQLGTDPRLQQQRTRLAVKANWLRDQAEK